MLIDTAHIDHLRVNFVSHFNTDNQTIGATNEITDLLETYPEEMTSQLRQWLTEQQKSRLTAPLATIDTSKSIDDFDEYLREMEAHISAYNENEPNESKLKVREREFRGQGMSDLFRKLFNKSKNDRISRRISPRKIENVWTISNNAFIAYKNKPNNFEINRISRDKIPNKSSTISIN